MRKAEVGKRKEEGGPAVVPKERDYGAASIWNSGGGKDGLSFLSPAPIRRSSTQRTQGLSTLRHSDQIDSVNPVSSVRGKKAFLGMVVCYQTCIIGVLAFQYPASSCGREAY